MVLLKHLKKQLNQLVMPEIEALPPGALNLYSREAPEDVVPLQQAEPRKSQLLPLQDPTKAAYSHGFEEIYAIQDIDVTKIKPMGSGNEPKMPEPDRPADRYVLPPSPQLEFDLGGEFRSTIESFLLHEPIRVLKLSVHAERYLTQHGKLQLKSLVDEDWSAFSIAHGSGQGHIDEIKVKLRDYIAGRPLKNCNTVDFEAFLRGVIPDEDRAKLYILLDKYRLGHLVILTPSETVEIKRLTPEQKDGLVQESLRILRAQNRVAFCEKNFQDIAEVFVKPWMRARSGFCRRYELMDRLEQISDDPSSMHSVVSFLGDVYYKGEVPFAAQLPSLGGGTYCVDEAARQNFFEIEKRALTYFYKTDVVYTLAELSGWISRECANKWDGYADGLVEKVLCLSKRFHVAKDERGRMIVSFA